jgi:hypothetical protein
MLGHDAASQPFLPPEPPVPLASKEVDHQSAGQDSIVFPCQR